ncbi:dihydroneopterin triphosphate diphosphatase [Salinimonas sp. HHU 13199]|uniref:Dihydroneopterin triphosphate diphosphatase n=1 Tax=Salinimonas profundi TaxID=2729140 RepID=A0ABR8LJ62_9ALTE|nr:dihydroneopterin triphosphate diphosphatase [Salinimonas profundi]MBD3585126.1 dihydroneopterin triphosphate diphosphatase [Salinimonas profundi]
MSLKRPESVLVVLYDLQHRVLVMQRNDDAEFWQSVTGTIEAGETPLQTAYREVAEETGLQLHPDNQAIVDQQTTNIFKIREKWLHRYPPGTRYNREHVFTAQVDSDTTLILTEHSAYEWLSKAEALSRLWSQTNVEAVETFVPEAK